MDAVAKPERFRPSWKRTAALALLIFLVNVALNAPLFLPGDAAYRDSIEGGYRGMSRFITDHPNPWGWNPLQYCGLPLQFTYVPALHYSVAAISRVTQVDPLQAYRVLTALFACLGPVTVFLFVRFFTRSDWWGLAAGFGYTFFSPLYGLIRQLDQDRGVVYLPWRLHVFAKYGESPHISGLTVIPLALLATWVAGTGRRFWQVPLAAVLLAVVVLTNWVAALGLALCSLVLLLAAIGATTGFRWWRVIAAGLLAYGFACFWLTPSFVQTIAFNWPVDSFNYKLQIAQRWLIVGWVISLIVLRVLMWLLKWPFYPTFVSLAMFAFGYPVLMFYSYGVDMLPESRRYAPEFELFLLLTMVAFFQLTFTRTNHVRLVCGIVTAVGALVAGFPHLQQYVTQGYSGWRPIPIEQTTEHRVARWIAEQRPQGRVLASGGLRFRLNSWFDLQQVGGAFESGLKNRVPVHFSYQIRTSIGSTPETDAADSIRQMKALGVEYIVIHGPNSDEHYRDYQRPMKFEGVLERVYANEDDYVYRVPFRSLAHLIKPDEQPPYPLKDWIGKYVEATDDSNRPHLDATWTSTSQMEIRGPVPAGHDISVAVTSADGWRATQDGAPVPIESNKLNFIVVKAKPSPNSVIRLQFGSTVEQRAMFMLSLGVWIGTGLWLRKRWRQDARYDEEPWQTQQATSASA